jgi:hypothetical protein
MLDATTIVVSDPELLAKLASTNGVIVFRDPGGKTIRMADPVPVGQLPRGIQSPISDEEIEKARKQPDGLPLAEVWKRIHEKYGP